MLYNKFILRRSGFAKIYNVPYSVLPVLNTLRNYWMQKL